MKDLRAGMEPAPFVERTHAAPRSPQTLAICGMFGIGMPPTDARPKAFRSASLTCAPAVVLAGKRPFAAASASCDAGRAMYVATRSFASDSTPCVDENFVTMKP